MSGIDLARVLREIDEEVRARRAAGDVPPGLERELDLAFAKVAPARSDDGFGGFLEAAERLAFIDVEVPTGSNLPAVEPVKRGLRKLMLWYLRYVAQQTSAFASSSVAALRVLGRRVGDLEASSPVHRRVLDEGRQRGPTVDVAPFAELLTAHLAPVAAAGGRVLVAECGDGTLLRRLADGGASAYGLDPAGAVALGAGPDLELASEELLDHVRGLADGVLGGLVLLGAVDRLPRPAQLELADRAADVLADGGRVAVVAATPAGWARAVDPVDADLAPGRPLHPATWAHLLGERGFDDVVVHDGPAEPLAPVGDEALDAALARVSAALFGPDAAVVTGTRRARRRP